MDHMNNALSRLYVQMIVAVSGHLRLMRHPVRLSRNGMWLFSFLIVHHALPQGTWERVTIPVVQDLTAVCFVDSLFGWVVGDSGTILHTTDGGHSWTLQESGTANGITGVFFLDRDRGWACAFNYSVPPYGTLLLKTVNGGETWLSTPYPEENIFINCIHYLDSLTGWMGGSPHALVRTNDGGNTWVQAAIDTSTLAFFPVLNVAFYNADIGYATGGIFDIAGVIWRTSNGGDMWYAIDPLQAPADEVHALHIFDENRAIGCGGDPDFGYGVGMIRTDDGGQHWTYADIGIQGIAYDMDFRTSSQAWSPLGPQRKLIFSLDTGESWSEVPTPDSTSIFDITFPDSLHGFGVGSDGAVIRHLPPVQPYIAPLTSDEEVVRVYPNPTAGNTKFEIRTRGQRNSPSPNSNMGFTLLEIYDLPGTKRAEVIHQVLPPGTHLFSFDAGKLPAGIYLYQLRVNGAVRDQGKLVVMR